MIKREKIGGLRAYEAQVTLDITWHELSWECQDYIRTSSWNIIGENWIWQKPMKFNWGKNWNMTWANDQTVCNWNAKHDFFFLWFALTRHQTSERERELAICSCTNAYWSRDVLLYVQNYFPSNVACHCEAALKKPWFQKLIFCPIKTSRPFFLTLRNGLGPSFLYNQLSGMIARNCQGRSYPARPAHKYPHRRRCCP